MYTTAVLSNYSFIQFSRSYTENLKKLVTSEQIVTFMP